MSKVHIPDIESLHEFVSNGVDEEVNVYIHDEDPNLGPVAHPSHALVREVVTQTLKDVDAPPDPDLDRLCIAVGRRVVGRIARSQGLTVESSNGSEKKVFHPESDGEQLPRNSFRPSIKRLFAIAFRRESNI